MRSTRELEAPRLARSQGWGYDGCVHTPRHATVRLVEYRYLIISTRVGWHMTKFKIHALECTRTRHFYVKIRKFSGSPDPSPRVRGHPGGGGGGAPTL